MPKANSKNKQVKSKTKSVRRSKKNPEQEIINQLQTLNKQLKSALKQAEYAYQKLDPKTKKGILAAAAALTAVLAGSKLFGKKRKTK